ncbi:hypothetical protein, partial [Paenibacillus alginolyticus]
RLAPLSLQTSLREVLFRRLALLSHLSFTLAMNFIASADITEVTDESSDLELVFSLLSHFHPLPTL